VQRGEIEGRVEPFYYIPEIVELEKKVRNISTQRLKNFIISISSGATPSVREEEKFYSSEENGIPFIRVQNLSYTNELILDDLKYINQETHQNYLNRSQIREGYLLVKITGVGRMAISSVVPKDFEGNINQHLVAIKTKDCFTSEVLATFLNTDIGEKLASRRATGGTRPALDYTALKSIPIVFKPEIVEIVKKAVLAKRAKEAEAKALLAGIDEYLLNALGIRLPEPTEKKKFFYMRANQISGGRFDPDYFDVTFSRLRGAIHSGNYPIETLSKICEFISNGKTPAKNEYSDEVTPYPIIKVASYSGDTIDLDKVDYANNPRTCFVKEGDIFVLAAAHQPNYVGRFVKQLNENPTINTSFVGELICLRAQQLSVKSGYLFALLSTKIIKTLLNCEKRGQTSHIYPGDIRKILIPLPPLAVQTEIAEYIRMIRAQAKQLEQEAKEIIERAKQEVEAMILGS